LSYFIHKSQFSNALQIICIGQKVLQLPKLAWINSVTNIELQHSLLNTCLPTDKFDVSVLYTKKRPGHTPGRPQSITT